jgi:hypothetical protein
VAVSFIETTDLPQVNDKLKETFLEAKNVTGLESTSGDLENQLNIYLKLIIILYADDTVILSESESVFTGIARCFPGILFNLEAES